MSLNLSKKQIILIVSVIVLTITAPTRKDWIEFYGFGTEATLQSRGWSLKKDYNFIIINIYTFYDPYNEYVTRVGILKNFIKITDNRKTL